MTKLYLPAVTFLFVSAASAQSLDSGCHYTGAFFGKSIVMLGSSDIRVGGGLSYGYAKSEPRFKLWTLKGQFLLTGYLDHTWPIQNRAGNAQNYSTGFLAGARWLALNSRSNITPYFDFGWGFQMADQSTLDLPSELNSTPWAGTGIMVPIGKYQTLFGIRFVHISNAGFVKPNRGEDELFLTSEIRI